MNFSDALMALKAGKTVRLSKWYINAYIFIRNDELIMQGFGFFNEELKEIVIDKIEASWIFQDDWEIVEYKK